MNEEAKHLLDYHRAAAERVETKAALVIGAALAAAQFVAKEPRVSYWLPCAMAGYVLSITFGVMTVLPRRLENVGLEEAMLGVWWWNAGRAAAELANNRNVAIKANAKRHQARLAWFWLSLAALGLGAIMSVGHLTMGKRTDDRQRLNGTCSPVTASTFVCTARP